MLFNHTAMSVAKIQKGDTVKVIAGKDKGKTGKVVHVAVARGTVTVDGVNTHKRHVRPKRQGEKGEVVEKSAPFALSNVLVVCPSCGKPTRVGVKRTAKGGTRVCKHCNHEW